MESNVLYKNIFTKLILLLLFFCFFLFVKYFVGFFLLAHLVQKTMQTIVVTLCFRCFHHRCRLTSFSLKLLGRMETNLAQMFLFGGSHQNL